MKSKIYFSIFREYKSAVIIINDAIRLGKECGVDQTSVERLYKQLYRFSVYMRKEEQGMAADNFAEFAATYQVDSSARIAMYYWTGLLYEQQGDYQKAYDWLNGAGAVHSKVYNNILLRTYLKLDSISAALAYVGRHRKNSCSLSSAASLPVP